MMISEDTKTRIRENTKALFKQFGIQRVSMDDIAKAAGISKKTLCQYYPDKENLVLEVIELLLQSSCDSCKNSRENAENAIQESIMAVDHVTEMMKKMNPVLLIDMQRYYPAVYKKFLQFKQDFLYNYIKYNIEWGIKDGLYREDINPQLISRYRIESIGLPFKQELFDSLQMDLATVQKEIFLFFLHGLASPKGIKLINKYKSQRAKKNI